MRVGAFASGGTTRAQAGASYYGIMELSGNLLEVTVSLGAKAGRSYTGLHGNGNLFRDGSADVDYWPGINGNNSPTVANSNTTFAGVTGVTMAAGSGRRGGCYANFAWYAPVSERNLSNLNWDGRDRNGGFRGVRSAP